MENFENNENINLLPESLCRLEFNSAFKNNFQLENSIFESKRPLKSTMNLVNNNNNRLQLDYKDNKCLKYPLLKSISFSNIKFKNNNNTMNGKFNYEDEKYNENALEDEPKDFMHMNENKIYINNYTENYEAHLNHPKVYNNCENNFKNNLDNNYSLLAQFDEDRKKKYDDYFNTTNEN